MLPLVSSRSQHDEPRRLVRIEMANTYIITNFLDCVDVVYGHDIKMQVFLSKMLFEWETKR